MLTQIDTAIFYFFNHTCQNAVFNKVMPLVTELGDARLIFIIALCMLIFKKKNIRVSALLLLAGLTLSYYASLGLKVLIARPRPFLTLTDVHVLTSPSGNLSFPSGHATIAFMAALVLTRCFKRWYLFYGLAIIVAISRIYVGVHYPTDVIAGGILGSIIGYILVRISTPADFNTRC